MTAPADHQSEAITLTFKLTDHFTSGGDPAYVVTDYKHGQFGFPKRLTSGSTKRARQIDHGDLMASHGREHHGLQLLGLRHPARRRFTSGHGQQIDALDGR